MALHCSAWSASANGENVGQWRPSRGPWMLTPPGTGVFCPSTNSSSPRELSGHHSNCGFLALGVGAQGPASLPNTWVSWGSMKVEPGPSCADGGCAMLGGMSSPGRTGKKDKLSGNPPTHPILCSPMKHRCQVYYLSQQSSTGGHSARPPPGDIAMSGDIFGCNDWEKGSYWYLVDGAQGRCSTPHDARDGATTENYQPANVSSAEKLGKQL